MVVGLGNPGVDYEASRHNVGFLAVEVLADRAGAALTRRRYRSLYGRGALHSKEIMLVKPLTFMNESGSAVSSWQQALGLAPSSIIVIHDDLDLPISLVRIKAGGGHGGHKGVLSIVEALGRADFLRVKVGIGRPRPGHDPVTHVLEPFEKAERGEIEGAVERAADAVETVLRDGLQAARNRYNVRVTRRQVGTDQEEGGSSGELV
ncbi:MAG: aminoacyl-tRNA hydrolase [Candidatus Methylomirabilis sp.]